MSTVVIIGAGASGMLAALTAAETADNRVILLERQQRVGRKLMATGNGRCNLTNTGAGPESYHGENPAFAAPAMAAFPPEAVLGYFGQLGLLTTEEYGGRVYPLSQSANSVVDVLRFALEQAGVELVAPCVAQAIHRAGRGYTVVTDKGDFAADYVIVACGGAAGAKLGGVKDGYTLLKELGHKRTALYPSLAPILTEQEYPRALKGVRTEAKVTLLAGEDPVQAAEGELQFTETGISGPVSFALSRTAAELGEGLTAEIDFLQGYDAGTVLQLLRQRRKTLPMVPAQEVLTGLVHNRLGKMLVKYAAIPAVKPAAELTDAELERLCGALKGFRLRVTGTEGLDVAQVTAGGIRTAGINPETLESWFMPGLFICGELLDIDGDCGGFNLQWAWASGRLAGRLGK